MDQPCCWLSAAHSPLQSLQRKIHLEPITWGPADNPPGEQIDYHHEMPPAACGPDV